MDALGMQRDVADQRSDVKEKEVPAAAGDVAVAVSRVTRRRKQRITAVTWYVILGAVSVLSCMLIWLYREYPHITDPHNTSFTPFCSYYFWSWYRASSLVSRKFVTALKGFASGKSTGESMRRDFSQLTYVLSSGHIWGMV